MSALPDRVTLFFSKVERAESGCLVWTGAQRGKGYGAFRDGEMYYAHRWAYQLERGPIPKGLTVDHLCRNKLCVNVDHLELVTPAGNTRRSFPFRSWGLKTHCKHGHEMVGDNVVMKHLATRIERRCRQCIRRDNRESAARKRDLKAFVMARKAVTP